MNNNNEFGKYFKGYFNPNKKVKEEHIVYSQPLSKEQSEYLKDLEIYQTAAKKLFERYLRQEKKRLQRRLTINEFYMLKVRVQEELNNAKLNS